MKIRVFNKVIEDQALVDHNLNDRTVVIDGHNFFYGTYKRSGLQFVFGCESDKYAEYLRNYLAMFKKANVKCYFLLKGGHEDVEKRMMKKEYVNANDFIVGQEYDDIVLPVFMKDVYKQVLEEMDFNFVICELDAKKECIAFAQKHQCPIISYDIEFCFSGLQYIPYPHIDFKQNTNQLDCKLFDLDYFLRKFKLTEEQIAIFIVLTDRNIFPEDHFINFIIWLRIPIGNYKRNLGVLNWLSKTKRQVALDCIFRFNPDDKDKFLEEEAKARSFIRRRENPGLPTEFLENKTIEIKENDPKWFEKGIILKHIPIPYVNLYRDAVILGSWAIQDKKGDDALIPTIEIIKYAYDLMENFQGPYITVYKKDQCQMTVSDSLQKPSYEATNTVFENGWTGIRPLNLFEHFLIESLQGFNFKSLKKLSEDARLLMIALIYFSRKKPADTKNEVYSILLSYIALDITSEHENTNGVKPELSRKPILDSTTEKGSINQNDKSTAAAVLAEYFSTVSNQEAKNIFNPSLIHPLVEFQHILQHLNYLNTLCGCPYIPTVYSKTFNGTFVYKILYEINKNHANDGLKFLTNKLNPAPTVLAFMHGLIETYEDTLYA